MRPLRLALEPGVCALITAAFLLLRQSAGQPGGGGYTDARQCAACHAKIAAAYAKTGMARSFYKPRSLDKTRFYHEPSGTWYAMEAHDGGYYQRRWRIGYDGGETDAQESRIDYVMGSGNHVRTYLHQTQRGALIELPLAWYAENGGSWAMNPGHDRTYSLPPRAIAYECMFCHNAYPAIPAGHDEPASEPLYNGALPEGIDCQRCHGPGGNHVNAARTPRAQPDDIRGAIFNPARLSAARQMEVCMQCHLETTSLQLPHSIRRYRTRPFGYQPAQPLGSFMIFFDHTPGSRYEGDFEIAHSAYRLRKSQCFLASKGAMTCTRCHDPHGIPNPNDIPRGAAAAKHYNGVCVQCHTARFRQEIAAGKHTSAEDCVGCHMPKRRTSDVIHAVMTDHYIERRPPAGDLLAPLRERDEAHANSYRGEVVPYYPAPLAPAGDNALYLAVAQVTQKSNLKNGLPRLEAEIARQKPARPEFYLESGEAWLSAGNARNAVRAFEEAVKREPDSPVALLDLADALMQSGQKARAAEVLNHGVRVAPDDPLLWYQLGFTEMKAGHEPQALQGFEKAVSLDPEMPEAQHMLGAALAGAGEPDRAEAALRNALRLSPDLAEAQGDLAHLLAARGDLAQARYYFARSVLLKPGDAEVRVNYAVTLAGLRQFAEARQQAEAAVKTDPQFPDAHNFLGTLLAREGQADNALREFLEAARLRPDFGLAHLNAAGLLAQKGDTAAAQSHLRQAAQDPDPNIRQRAIQGLR